MRKQRVVRQLQLRSPRLRTFLIEQRAQQFISPGLGVIPSAGREIPFMVEVICRSHMLVGKKHKPEKKLWRELGRAQINRNPAPMTVAKDLSDPGLS